MAIDLSKGRTGSGLNVTAPAHKGGGGFLGAFARSPIAKALSVLDLPRALVVGLGEELGNAGRPLIGKERYKDYGLLHALKTHEGVGTVLARNGISTGNKWGDRALGFAGDVASDPLTYLSFGTSKIAEGGAKAGEGARALSRLEGPEAARLLAKEAKAAEAAGDAAKSRRLMEAAERAAKNGAGHAGNDALKEIGAKSGLTFHVPGTKIRAVAEGTDQLADKLAEITGRGKNAIKASRPASKLGEIFETVPGMTRVKQTQEFGNLKALAMKDANRLSRHESLALSQDLAKELGRIAKEYHDVDINVVRDAMEGATSASGREAAAAKELGQWFKQARAEANANGAHIGEINDYLPHRMTKLYREYLAENGGKAGTKLDGKMAAELKREYTAGTKWFGEELQHGSIEEMNRIAREKLGDNFAKVFKDNPWELAQSYIYEIQRKVQGQKLLKAIAESDLLSSDPLTKTATPVKRQAVLRRQAARAEQLAESQGAQAADARLSAALKAQAGEDLRTAAQAPKAMGQEALAERGQHLAVAGGQEDLAQRLASLAQEQAPKVVPQVPAPDSGAVDRLLNELDRKLSKTERLAARPGKAKDLAKAEGAAGRTEAELDQAMRAFDSAKAAHDNAQLTAQANQAALEDTVRKLEGARGRQRAALQAAEIQQRWADRMFSKAEELTARGDGEAAAAVRLQASAASLEGEMAKNKLRALTLESAAAKLTDSIVHKDIAEMAKRGLSEFEGTGRYTERWVPEMVDEVRQQMTPENIGNLLKGFDWVTNRWKAYALLSPGFHFRNWFGGMFNNSLAGVEIKSYGRFAKAMRQFKRGGYEAIADDEVRAAFKVMHDEHVLSHASIRDISDIPVGVDDPISRAVGGGGALGKSLSGVDPTSLDFLPLRKNREAAEMVEDHLRGTLFMDRFLKTGSASDALDAVDKYHFDYSDLSKLEKRVVKRVVPFYTWTRKNFPLQIEMMLKQPGHYTMYLHLKRNVEMGVGDIPFMPDYIDKMLGIRTDLKVGGQHKDGGKTDDAPLILTPDLPFRDLAETLNTNHLLGMVNPLIKTPLEVRGGKTYEQGLSLTDDLKPFPKAWEPLLPALIAAHGAFGMPKVVKAKSGQYLISNKDAYKIEQAFPVAGRGRRLVPSEERFQNRAGSSWGTFLTGVSTITLDSSQQGGTANGVKLAAAAKKKRDKQIATQ